MTFELALQLKAVRVAFFEIVILLPFFGLLLLPIYHWFAKAAEALLKASAIVWFASMVGFCIFAIAADVVFFQALMYPAHHYR